MVYLYWSNNDRHQIGKPSVITKSSKNLFSRQNQIAGRRENGTSLMYILHQMIKYGSLRQYIDYKMVVTSRIDNC